MDKEDSGLNRTYKGLINKLPENGIFVFGSNTEGRHGKGAALQARIHFGAKYGQASGLQGRSYAIATKDLRKTIHPSISKQVIINQIAALYHYARKNPNMDFYVAYSAQGKNLNGYTNLEMMEMFAEASIDQPIPINIVFEEEFYYQLKLIHLEVLQFNAQQHG